MKIKSIKGVHDVLPDDVWIWQVVESTVRSICSQFGYEEIRVPILEEARLFNRSIGETTDIVEKEMFQFKTAEESEYIALRPEFTAGVVRSIVEHELYKTTPFLKLFYIGPAFRRERPQKGRFRQFHQFGVEAIGSYDPLVDAETIALFSTILDELLIKGSYKVKLGSLGCSACKKSFKELLKKELRNHIDQYCPTCQNRYERNIFRLLDCKNTRCADLSKKLSSIFEVLCLDCKDHFDTLKKALTSIDINFVVEPRIVRGIDYYTRTVYEFVSSKLGSQDALGGGGRYDNLISDLGGPKIGAVGFAAGIERIVMTSTLNRQQMLPDFFIVYVGEQCKMEVFKLQAKLRRAGLTGTMDLANRSVKAQMRSANKTAARFAIIVGDNELSKSVVRLKDLGSGTEKEVNIDEAIRIIKH